MSKVISTLPVSDGTIYVDAYGYFNERIGVAFTEDEETKFINYYGYVDDLPRECPDDAIVGKKGDTKTLRDLSIAFECNDDPSCIVEQAQKYFNLDLSNLPDTVVFSFDTRIGDMFEASLHIDTEEFPEIGIKVFDLTKEDYECKHPRGCGTLAQNLIPVLLAYAEIIGKRPNIEIYIQKTDNFLFTPKEIETQRRKIEHEEELFLPRLRRYVNEKLDKAMEIHSSQAKEMAEQVARGEEIRQGSLTKYDHDPNLGIS